MIHSHYDSEQILWFVRNFWKYTRENMILEFRRTFHDPNFAKSQYQWLKTRYGMKEEWGASLNNPPYSGARPGGPGTEHYEPPDIPSRAPQMIFRTRSDSPTPNLVVAPPPAPVESTGQAHTAGVRSRVPSSGSLRAVSSDSCDYSDGSSLQTPTNTASGTPGFPASILTSNGIFSVPGQISPLTANGMNGTYTFDFQELGSPFVPAAAQMGSFNANNATSMATLNAPYHMPASTYDPLAAMNPFLGANGENHTVTNSQQHANSLTGSGNPDHMLLAAFPFATTQPFQSAGGQYSGSFHHQAATDSITQQHALTGLGINNQNYLGPQVRPGPLANIGNMISATNMNRNAYRSRGSGSSDQFSLQGSHASSPESQGLMETIVSPHGPTVGPIKSRKRKLVEVECRPPTLPSLVDPALQAARNSAGASPASSRVVAAAQVSAYDVESPAKRVKSTPSSVAASSPLTATAAAAPGPADNIAATYSPVVNSPKTPMSTSASVGSHAGGNAAMNPSALPSVAHSTEQHRRVPEAPTMQAQLGSLALAQVTGVQTSLVFRDHAAPSQLQTPSTSRSHSMVLPIHSRPASRDAVCTSAPPSIAVSPNDKNSGASSRAVWPGMPAPTDQDNLSHAASYSGNAAPVDASTVTPAATAFDETSSVHGFSLEDYDTIDFGGSSVDLDSTSSFDEAMDKLLFGDSFPGEANVAMDAGTLQDIAAVDPKASSSAGSNASDTNMSTMFAVDNSYGSGELGTSQAPFSLSRSGSPSTSWFE